MMVMCIEEHLIHEEVKQRLSRKKVLLVKKIVSMIDWTEITYTEIFTFIAVLVFKLLSLKVLFLKTKDNRNS